MENPSETILSKLKELGINYSLLVHEPIYTVDAGMAIVRRLDAEPCKSLLLCTRHKEYYMALLSRNNKLSVKDISKQIGCSHLSFASPEDLEKLLHTKPGAVSPLGLIFDTDSRINLLIDTKTVESDYMICHPNDNTCSLKISTTDILKVYLPANKHSEYQIIIGLS